MSTFIKQFQLHPSILQGLEKLHFQDPTPIQLKSIPIILDGKDLVACAQTGTGKTAAFSIPLVMHFLNKKKKMALMLAPTRELALQIEDFWRNLTKFTPNLKATCIIGGTSFTAQIHALKTQKPKLLIATPGRLIDHLNRRTIHLDMVDFLVLDEADRMLDMGFAPQLKKIFESLTQKRQTLLFSATWNTQLNKMIEKYLQKPEQIVIGEASRPATSVTQEILYTTTKDKNATLLDILNQRQGSILVFARTQARTDRLVRYLHEAGLVANCLHGGRTQVQRKTALAAFKTGKARILVATDIASRGIDIQEIAYVINYDLPQAPEDYIHRIGRTGRAGHKGKALSLLTPEDRSKWKHIVRMTHAVTQPLSLH